MNCPYCNSENIAGILYGLPSDDKELEQEIERGELILGGCLVHDGAPTLHCNECNKRWGSLDISYTKATESDGDGDDFVDKFFKL